MAVTVGILSSVLFFNFFTCTSAVTWKNCTTESSEVTCTWTINKHANCTDDYLQKTFPTLFDNSQGFPNGPSNLTVVSSYQIYNPNYPNLLYPQISLFLQPPQDSSRKDVKGFQIDFIKTDNVGEVENRCIIMVLHESLSAQSSMTGFFVNLFPMSGGTTFYFKALSLPKPEYDEQDEYRKEAIVTTWRYRFDTNAVPSADWSTTITYYNNSQARSITFIFVEPPAKYNFDTFDITLSENSTHDKVDTFRFKNHFNGVFENLEADKYYIIKISPFDEYFNDPSKCLCKNSNNNCASCVMTVTRPIYIRKKTEVSTIALTTEAKTAVLPHIGESKEQDNEGVPLTKIVPAIVGAVVGATLIAVILFFFVLQKRRSTKNSDASSTISSTVSSEPDKNKRNKSNGIISHINNGFEYNGDTPGMPALSRKRIFLVHAEDHPKHLDVLKSFAKFLTADCYCDVVFAPWCNISDKLQWIISSMNNCDFTIIVNSAAAFTQHQAWKNNNTNKYYKPITKAGDIFLPAIGQITDRLARNMDVAKFMAVTFYYTKDKHILADLACMQYRLPKHHDDFLCHIHGLDATDPYFDRYSLPSSESLASRQSGQKLLESIMICTQYETAETDESVQMPNRSEEVHRQRRPLQPIDMPLYQNMTRSVSQEAPSTYSYAYNQLHNFPQQNQYSDLYVDPNNGEIIRVPRGYRQQEEEEMYEAYHEEDSSQEYLDVLPNDFHPPSAFEEDVTSNCLQQEIQKINNNYQDETQNESSPTKHDQSHA